MRRTFLFVVIAFLAGLGAGYFAHRAHADSSLRKDTHAADFAGIEKLRQQDIDVTLPQDPKGLIDIFTDDAVRFNPGNPTAVGKQAIAAENEKFRAQYRFQGVELRAQIQRPPNREWSGMGVVGG
jgi:hypothetical protein